MRKQKITAIKPCKNCPWKKSSRVGGADIVGFSLEKMKGLKDTVPPRGSEQDGFYKVMACHCSQEYEEFACAGYMAAHADENINARILVAQHDIDLNAIKKECAKEDMYTNFFEMLDDYVAAND